MKIVGIMLGLCLMGLCGQAEAEQLEPLLGLETDLESGLVVFVVASSGCTSKADFRVENENDTVSVYRLQRDACKRMPFRERIDFRLDELGLSPHKPFALGNLFVVNENVLMM